MGPILDNVDRVAAPDVATLRRDHLERGRPVILTGLARRSPARRLADLRTARAAFAHLRLPVRPNPVTEIVLGNGEPPEDPVPFGDLLDRLRDGGRPWEGCIEYETPSSVAAWLPPPAYVAEDPADDGWTSFTFVAGAGHATHLHYDVDLRPFVMQQVFGHKRYVLLPPSSTVRLAPKQSRAMPYISGLFLQETDRAGQEALLRATGGWDCVVGPGEALVVPTGTWHFVEYLDPAMSVSFRLPRNAQLQFLAEELPRCAEVQVLSTVFRNPGSVGAAEAFGRLWSAARAPYHSERARSEALRAACAEVCDDLGLPVVTTRRRTGADLRVRRFKVSAGLRPAWA